MVAEAIWSTSGAFLAKLRDGSFIAWGDKDRGADVTTVKDGADLVGAEALGMNLQCLLHLRLNVI